MGPAKMSSLLQRLNSMDGGRIDEPKAHPNVHPAWSTWSESQTLHVACAYNNPFRWRKRRVLLENFRHHVSQQPNVKLYVGELAYADRPFEVTGQNLNDVQLRTRHEMWHKENLINVIVSRFPADWQYGAYCDGDFTFTRHDWALEAIHLLQHYDFVQLFSTYTDLSVETATSWRGHRPYRTNSTFAWDYLHPEEFQKVALKRQTAAKKSTASAPVLRTSDGLCYGGTVNGISAKGSWPFGLSPGAPGGAWAFRRSAFDTVGGLLDCCVVGAADVHMVVGLVEGENVHNEMNGCQWAYLEAITNWQERAARLSRNIGCLDQHAIHHFHGSHKLRSYGTRSDILRNHDFDPKRDLVRDWQGVWQLAGNKPRLRDDLRRYFIERWEDSTEMAEHERNMV